ncbi:MAG: DUF5625 family protein [Thalassotalea sp.]
MQSNANKSFQQDKKQLVFAPASLILTNYFLPLNEALAFMEELSSMGPIRYSLCQTEYLDFVMWALFLCGFPSLFSNIPISLEVKNSTISVPFEVQVDKPYTFQLNFLFETKESYLDDKILGSRFSKYCVGDVDYDSIPVPDKDGLGLPLDFNIEVTNRNTNAIVVNKDFTSLCRQSRIPSRLQINRIIGTVQINKGDYIAKITYLNSPLDLQGAQATITLSAGNRK